MSQRTPDQPDDQPVEPITDRLALEAIRRDSIFYERLSALERDVTALVAAVGDRGDPLDGAGLGEIAAELARFYDDRRITPESVEPVLEDLVGRDVLETPGPNSYRATLETGSSVEHYLERLGELWEDKIPEEDGAKIEIERRQVTDPDAVRGAP